MLCRGKKQRRIMLRKIFNVRPDEDFILFPPLSAFFQIKFHCQVCSLFYIDFLDVFLFFSHGDCTTIFVRVKIFFFSRSGVAHSQPPLQIFIPSIENSLSIFTTLSILSHSKDSWENFSNFSITKIFHIVLTFKSNAFFTSFLVAPHEPL